MFKTLDDGSLDVTKKKPGQLREISLQVARHLLADRIPYTVVNIIHSTDVSSLLCRDSIVDYKALRSRSNLSLEIRFEGNLPLYK